MIGNPAIATELRQHRQCARRKRLVDEWLLLIDGFNCRTAGQRIFARFRIDDLWK
jgi:hypothetical protein